ncbi:MAG: UDP-N-acetylmuramoyl-tripeptide--D-alanyl-D-alanine ligase [Janthinobacterium lividum]
MYKLWTHEDIKQALGVSATGNFSASGISLDSRTLQKGDVFVALQGPLYDGAKYVAHAFEQGAAAAIVCQSAKDEQVLQNVLGPCVYVDDILKALQDLAAFARHRTQATIIGITGSFGKTSTKEALKLIFSSQGSVTANQRSFNNHWGVPLTLAQLKPDDDFGVIEMGMNNPGEIEISSQLARPQVALILNVRAMHLQGLGSIEGIARAKSEIFSGMSPGDVTVLNADDPTYPMMREIAGQKHLRVLSFGSKDKVDFQLLDAQSTPDHLALKVCLQAREKSFVLPPLGEHWALNVLGILAVVTAVDFNVDQAIACLQQYQLPEGRGSRQVVPFKEGTITIIDESYNAGFDSMQAALKVLGSYKKARRIAILGDMNEIGPESAREHENLKQILADNDIDLVFTCGKMMKYLHDVLPMSINAGYAIDVKDLVPEVLKILQPSDVIMIKGSKGQYAEKGRMHAFVGAILTQAVSEKGMTKSA